MTSVPSILVLADDLTGAAEIAAIGVEHGLKTELATAVPTTADASLLVIDTDTRPMSGPEAADRIRKILADLPRTALLFKKTDSVLRGQVMFELRAIQQVMGLPATLLVPQNPSKGRVIVGGQYLIDGVPLDRTSFRNDPEYPRMTAEVLSLLTGSAADVCVADVADGVGRTGITVGNAGSAEEMTQWAAVGNRENCLMAGGADLFRSFLDFHGHVHTPRAPIIISRGPTLMVCGSTAAYSRESVERWRREGLPVCPMPDGTDDNGANAWVRAARAQLRGAEGRAILSIGHAVSPERAIAFRRCMAEAVRQLVKDVAGDLTLVVEGGATAAAISASLGWTAFDVEGNLAPGVVAMRPLAGIGTAGLRMILKPGSYPWPANFLQRHGSA